MTKFFRLSSLASFAGALAFALVHPLASPARAGEAFRGGPEAAHQLMACGGGGSGAYRKPQRPTAHNHASPATPSPQSSAGSQGAKAPAAPSGASGAPAEG